MSEYFRRLRVEIEILLDEVKIWINKKSIYETSQRIEMAKEMLGRLAQMINNDIQQKAVKRLQSDIVIYENRIGDIFSKREAGKRQDGNIAFKCNWNDRNYKAPCSKEAYEYNLVEGRSWCRHPLCGCRTYNDDVTLAKHPCYESIALKEMYFGAGWDLSGDDIKFRRIQHVRTEKIAILTTRRPWTSEVDRIVVGCFYIDKVIDDPGAETKIFGDQKKCIELDCERIKIKFWDYYKNPESENSILWGTGLFRYISNRTVLMILRDIGEAFTNLHMNVKIIAELVTHYEKLVH